MKKFKLVCVCYDEWYLFDEDGNEIPDNCIDVESFDSYASFRKAYPKDADG